MVRANAKGVTVEPSSIGDIEEQQNVNEVNEDDVGQQNNSSNYEDSSEVIWANMR